MEYGLWLLKSLRLLSRGEWKLGYQFSKQVLSCQFLSLVDCGVEESTLCTALRVQIMLGGWL